MGCLKLTYQNFESPLKVVHRKTSFEQNNVQRFLRPDPLEAKYPELSPYHYAGGNPILFVDEDGNDYGVHINHTTGTVVIKANVYALAKDVGQAATAAMKWNNLNGKYQYKVGNGSDAKYYDIKFDVQVISENSIAARDDNAFNDPIGNNFLSAPDGTITATINGKVIPAHGTTEDPDAGNTKGLSQITVEQSSDGRNTGAHELGHAFGLKHRNKGLLESGGTRDPNDDDISRSAVRTILERSGLGKKPAIEFEYPTENQSTNNAKINRKDTGTAPSGFNRGKVKKKK